MLNELRFYVDRMLLEFYHRKYPLFSLFRDLSVSPFSALIDLFSAVLCRNSMGTANISPYTKIDCKYIRGCTIDHEK